MKILLFTCMFVSVTCFAQQKYITKTGLINFEASVPSFEEVSATNKSVTAILNSENGEFAALVLVKGFRFKNALMEEHFNENYAESNKFPKATFKGRIEEFSMIDLLSSKVTLNIKGHLTFHGITKEIKNLKVSILKVERSIIIEGNFKVLASDFNIEIPKVVSNKIADDIFVTFRFELLN